MSHATISFVYRLVFVDAVVITQNGYIKTCPKRPPPGANKSGPYLQVVSICRFHALVLSDVHYGIPKGMIWSKNTQLSKTAYLKGKTEVAFLPSEPSWPAAKLWSSSVE